jgi:hypothetical protein
MQEKKKRNPVIDNVEDGSLHALVEDAKREFPRMDHTDSLMYLPLDTFLYFDAPNSYYTLRARKDIAHPSAPKGVRLFRNRVILR